MLFWDGVSDQFVEPIFFTTQTFDYLIFKTYTNYIIN